MDFAPMAWMAGPCAPMAWIKRLRISSLFSFLSCVMMTFIVLLGSSPSCPSVQLAARRWSVSALFSCLETKAARDEADLPILPMMEMAKLATPRSISSIRFGSNRSGTVGSFNNNKAWTALCLTFASLSDAQAVISFTTPDPSPSDSRISKAAHLMMGCWWPKRPGKTSMAASFREINACFAAVFASSSPALLKNSARATAAACPVCGPHFERASAAAIWTFEEPSVLGSSSATNMLVYGSAFGDPTQPRATTNSSRSSGSSAFNFSAIKSAQRGPKLLNVASAASCTRFDGSSKRRRMRSTAGQHNSSEQYRRPCSAAAVSRARRLPSSSLEGIAGSRTSTKASTPAFPRWANEVDAAARTGAWQGRIRMDSHETSMNINESMDWISCVAWLHVPKQVVSKRCRTQLSTPCKTFSAVRAHWLELDNACHFRESMGLWGLVPSGCPESKVTLRSTLTENSSSKHAVLTWGFKLTLRGSIGTLRGPCWSFLSPSSRSANDQSSQSPQALGKCQVCWSILQSTCSSSAPCGNLAGFGWDRPLNLKV